MKTVDWIAVQGQNPVWLDNGARGAMGGIRLMVLSSEGTWRIRVGEKLSRPYKSQGEAVHAALKRATEISKEGLESEVVMKVMTCQFGPNGFFKAVSTPRETQQN